MTEFFKDKFNRFYADKQAALKRVDFQQWQKNLKEGGLTATSKADMNIMMKEFIDYILGKDILMEASTLQRQ
jgi:site-specific recombinase XerD